jgi:hypothetical protein
MGSPDDPFFGGSDKLYYSSEAKRLVEDLERWHVVAGKVDAYQIGLVIGVRAQKKEAIVDGINFGNLYSLRDEWVLKALMYYVHPKEEPKTRKDLMDQYAEAGIRILHDHAAARGGVADWPSLLAPAAPPPSGKL